MKKLYFFLLIVFASTMLWAKGTSESSLEQDASQRPQKVGNSY